MMIRTKIAEFSEQESPLKGEIEIDESYFGARRKQGKRGRGAYGKTPVFGILQRQGKVYTEIIPIVPKPRCKPLFEVKFLSKASSILTSGEDIMAW